MIPAKHMLIYRATKQGPFVETKIEELAARILNGTNMKRISKYTN